MPEDVSPAPYAHWMLREIGEQPGKLRETLERYVSAGQFRPDTCGGVRRWLEQAGGGIVIAASGSSRYAGQAAELLMEDLSGIAVDVEYASEYIYRSERALRDAAVIVVSQSGETVDTLLALRKAAAMGHQTLALTNVPGSTMAREATVSFPAMAGRERAVPATKSFTGQVLNLYLLALMAAELRGTLTADELRRRLDGLVDLPGRIEAQLGKWESSVREIAGSWQAIKSFLYLGRGVHYPIAREGALKLKESSYLHAEGYPSGELKHGPNALVSEGTPLVMLATVDRDAAESVERYGKVLQLMHDMRAQGGRILGVVNRGDREASALCEHVMTVEPCVEAELAISEIIPLQMFAYFMAVGNGVDVDHPRNLSKAVLAE